MHEVIPHVTICLGVQDKVLSVQGLGFRRSGLLGLGVKGLGFSPRGDSALRDLGLGFRAPVQRWGGIYSPRSIHSILQDVYL